MFLFKDFIGKAQWDYYVNPQTFRGIKNYVFAFGMAASLHMHHYNSNLSQTIQQVNELYIQWLLVVLSNQSYFQQESQLITTLQKNSWILDEVMELFQNSIAETELTEKINYREYWFSIGTAIN